VSGSPDPGRLPSQLLFASPPFKKKRARLFFDVFLISPPLPLQREGHIRGSEAAYGPSIAVGECPAPRLVARAGDERASSSSPSRSLLPAASDSMLLEAQATRGRLRARDHTGAEAARGRLPGKGPTPGAEQPEAGLRPRDAHGSSGARGRLRARDHMRARDGAQWRWALDRRRSSSFLTTPFPSEKGRGNENRRMGRYVPPTSRVRGPGNGMPPANLDG